MMTLSCVDCADLIGLVESHLRMLAETNRSPVVLGSLDDEVSKWERIRATLHCLADDEESWSCIEHALIAEWHEKSRDVGIG